MTEWLQLYASCFWISSKTVSHQTAAILVHVLCTPHTSLQCYSMPLYTFVWSWSAWGIILLFSVYVIHRTLTWTKGSLCMHIHKQWLYQEAETLLLQMSRSKHHLCRCVWTVVLQDTHRFCTWTCQRIHLFSTVCTSWRCKAHAVSAGFCPKLFKPTCASAWGPL